MRNKKSEMEFSTIVRASLALVILLVILGLIYTFIVGKQIPFIGGQTERVTEDCDGDGVIGISDYCPCNDAIQTKDQGKCTIITSGAEEKCPTLCKS